MGFHILWVKPLGTGPCKCHYSNAGGKQFIAKLQPDLSAYVYSTVFGSGSQTPNISPIAFLVDRCENVYISGWGGLFGNSNTFNSAGTAGLPVTPDAIKSPLMGKDIYFFVLKKDATSQLFGVFLVRLILRMRVWITWMEVPVALMLMASSTRLFVEIAKLTRHLSRFSNHTRRMVNCNNASTGGGCNLTMVKIAMNLAGVASGVQSAIDGVPKGYGRMYATDG